MNIQSTIKNLTPCSSQILSGHVEDISNLKLINNVHLKDENIWAFPAKTG